MPEIEDWATSPRAITKDETLTFEADILRVACETWMALAEGSIPPRSRFTARSVKAFVGNLVIFERLSADDYLIRLMGTRVTNTIGEMQGRKLTEALPSDALLRWTTMLNEVLANRKPVRVVTTVNFNDLHFLEAEIFLAPLTDDAGNEIMVFSAVAFRSGVAKSRSIADIVGTE